MSRYNPKISNISEKEIKIPEDYNAKVSLTEEEYKEYKSGNIKNEELSDFIERYIKIQDLITLNIRFEITNSPPEVTNALQKACTCEQDHYAFNVEYTDIHTNDPNLNKTELLNNIIFIPLNYDIVDDNYDSINFYINIKNNTNAPLPILSKDMNITGYKISKPLFYTSFELVYLDIGKTLKVDNIKVVRGNTRDHTKFLVATNGAIWPLDRKKGDLTINSTPLKHEVTFNISCVSPGKGYTKKIIKSACENLIERLTYILDIVSTDNPMYIEFYEKIYVLKIKETNGIAKLIERIYYTLYPNVEYITAELIYHTKNVTVHIKGSNIKDQLMNTLKECIRIYSNIKKEV